MNPSLRLRVLPCLLSIAAACSNAPLVSDGAADGGIDVASEASVDAVPPVDTFVTPRATGQRTPRSAPCESIDAIRCLLPWPSNTYTVTDATSATGLRLAVNAMMGVAAGDDPASINRADGFSRVTPLLTAFAGTIDPATLGDLTTGAIRLVVEQPGPNFGQLVPLRIITVNNHDPAHRQSMLVGYPRVPLAPATDYAVVVMDSARAMDGTALMPDRASMVALGHAPAVTLAEGALFAYFAPVRSAIVAAGVDPQHVLRAWDFTTRSLAQPTMDLTAMRAAEVAAVDTSAVAVAIDSAMPPTPAGTVALVVEGRLTGLPSYLSADGSLNRDSTGAPRAIGAHDAPFRIAIPVGTGSYRVVMYGHGTGGNVHDASFDAQITGGGAAKVGTQFIGWTDTGIPNTFANLARILVGSDISTAGLTQSLADAMAIQHALNGPLGDVLAAATIGGASNPAAGRRPNMALPVWAGGSLGGTMGFVYSAAEPSIAAAVLNVPGAAWTHFVVQSTLFAPERLIVHSHYPTDIDLYLGLATSQLNWDPVDGAAWFDAVGDHHPVLLEQESIGDPVLPNIGNEMVATASHAQQVGVALSPIVSLERVDQALGHNGMTQFRVPASVTSPLEIHGFAARDTAAGVAAQQQITAFIRSVWAGGTPTITVPAACMTNTPPGSCDFSAM